MKFGADDAEMRSRLVFRCSVSHLRQRQKCKQKGRNDVDFDSRFVSLFQSECWYCNAGVFNQNIHSVKGLETSSEYLD